MNSWEHEGAPWEAWVGEVEKAREKFAQLLQVPSRQIAILGSASEAASAVASALTYTSRTKILTSRCEFPTTAFVWLNQQRHGADIEFVASDDPEDPLHPSVYEECVDDTTLLVSVPQVNYHNGYRPNLPEVVRIARERGALTFVDAYQGLGVVPIDVRELGIDFLVAGSVKYLLGTSGIAFLYVREELIEKLEPTVVGWFAHENPFEFDPAHFVHALSAARFQSGTFAIPSVYAANAGLGLLNGVDPWKRWEHVRGLASKLMSLCQAAGLRVASPSREELRGPQVAVSVQEPNTVAAVLHDRGIIVSPRKDVIRLALHYYNNEADLARAVDEIAQLVHQSSVRTHAAHPS
jgi:selenocysteine lyase/cysteine desulfurase